jgi:dihydrofolate reductase
MRKVRVFENVSLDGFFADAANDMSWAHRHDPEWQAFTAGNASGGDGALLFGRVTYEQMAGFWPTPPAAQAMPEVARAMAAMTKYVVTRTLRRAAWENTVLVRGDLAEDVAALKRQDGPDLVVLGSGSVVSQLTQAGLVDAYQLVIVPVMLGRGRTLFGTVDPPRQLRLTDSRRFGNGNVVLSYEPA